MELYVLTTVTAREGENVNGVYSTLELAKDAAYSLKLFVGQSCAVYRVPLDDLPGLYYIGAAHPKLEPVWWSHSDPDSPHADA
jgi:hypothetical protein